MKTKLFAALIFAMLLLIAVGSTALADSTYYCDTCGKETEFMGFGYEKIDGTYHSLVLKCTVCYNRRSNGKSPHFGGDATCMRKAVCDGCHEEYGDLGSHKLLTFKEAATCQKEGRIYSRCSVTGCGYQKVDQVIPKTDHDLKPAQEFTREPTCTKKGWKSYYLCRNCTYSKTEWLDALDHDWGAWQPKGDFKTHFRVCTRIDCRTLDTANCSGDDSATCVKAGKCATCGWAYYGEHSYGSSWSYSADKHWQECVNCHEQRNEASHNFSQSVGEDNLAAAANCVSPARYRYVCADCGYQTEGTFPVGEIDPNNHDLVHHSAKAATCLEKGWKAYDTCKREGCGYTTYQEKAALGHDKVHHDAKNPTCTDYGWYAYDTCTRCDYSTRLIRPALGHDLVKHAAKNPTCTEIGWNAYNTCSRCSYTTYQEKAALGHDLVHHDAKAATCLEIGWKAYDTCSRCDYTTYEELKALGHDLVHHDAKAATCTDIGWKAYDTCSRCNYTTYAELPALGHDYKERVHEATCEEDGYTSHTCTRCGDRYLTDRVAKLEHWFGEWAPVEETTHEATCLREGCGFAASVDCEMIECTLALEGEEPLTLSLCPVCGRIEAGESLLLENVTAEALKGSLPLGEAFARLFTLENGEKLLAVGFEYGGRLVNAGCPVKLTLPAEALAGCTLAQVNPDGTQTALEITVDGELATVELDFTEIPAALIYLVPAA